MTKANWVNQSDSEYSADGGWVWDVDDTYNGIWYVVLRDPARAHNWVWVRRDEAFGGNATSDRAWTDATAAMRAAEVFEEVVSSRASEKKLRTSDKVNLNKGN